jgi:ATP-dependent Clp protease, protease subunit
MIVQRYNNEIYFNSDVNDDSCQKLIELINEYNDDIDKLYENKLINNLKVNPLIIFITTNGGELSEAFRVYNIIKNNKYDIYTVVDSICYSAGTIIYLAGMRRYIKEFSTIMVHAHITTYEDKNFNEIKNELEHDKILNKFMLSIYEANLEITTKHIKKLMEKNSYIYPEECIKYEFAHDYYNNYIN